MKTARQFAEEHFRDNDDWDGLIASYQQAMQAQHEATWAMAIDAAAQCVRENVWAENQGELGAQLNVNAEKLISTIPCPLQTNNKKT